MNLVRCGVSAVAAMLVASGPPAVAQSGYAYDAAEGGLVDDQTGLVWAAGPPLGYLVNTCGVVSYGFATGTMPGMLIAAPEGGGHADWRAPTQAELQDAAAKGLDAAGAAVAEADGTYFYYANADHWAAGTKKGTKAKSVNVRTGLVTTRTADRSYLPPMLVRGAPPSN
ncbi:MAG TPA: hypothetical protein VF170_07840 [Planctomycetaceae bacterium]